MILKNLQPLPYTIITLCRAESLNLGSDGAVILNDTHRSAFIIAILNAIISESGHGVVFIRDIEQSKQFYSFFSDSKYAENKQIIVVACVKNEFSLSVECTPLYGKLLNKDGSNNSSVVKKSMKYFCEKNEITKKVKLSVLPNHPVDQSDYFDNLQFEQIGTKLI